MADDKYGITKLDKVPKNNIGKVIMRVVITATITGLTMYKILLSSNDDKKSATGDGTEYISISTTEWVEVETDPKKESIGYGIIDQSLQFKVVMNRDFSRHILLPNSDGATNVQSNIRVLHFTLVPGQSVSKSEIRLKRNKIE